MDNTIRLNGEHIRGAFRDFYEKFYGRCSLVCSASANFYLCGEHVVLYGGPALLQKLPVRAYVGLEPTATRRVVIAPWQVFRPADGGFIEEPFPDGPRRRFRRLLPTLLAEVLGDDSKVGMNVHILLEFPAGAGINSSGAIERGSGDGSTDIRAKADRRGY